MIGRLPRLAVAAVMTAVLAIGLTAPVAAEMDEALAEELVALEQSKLEPWYGEASTAAYIDDIAADATYFDPWAPSKQYGPAVVEYLQGFEGMIPPLGFEITDPSVDVRGDVAIFTYNVENFDKATGEPAGLWMVTKVVSPAADGWEVIHIHYGAPLPPPDLSEEQQELPTSTDHGGSFHEGRASTLVEVVNQIHPVRPRPMLR